LLILKNQVMASFFNVADNQQFIHRIGQVNPDSPAQWGKMSAAQMLAHCCMPLQVGLGERQLKRTFIGWLLGGMAKRKLSRPDVPWDRNMPTDPSFRMDGQTPDFATEQARLVALVARFGQAGPTGITKDPHPFFGKLTAAEWDALQTNHLDHHLRQFGV
jgi:hypothetical protein